ncbi:MAG: 4Fe-4S dicluster domain-containing protein, partial [Planctomycetes bacterium]|nr:4Fe-4S dicluster domain-containing protein [Planctomycetota bacterium]
SFFSRQQRLVRQNTGALDAESMDDYLAVGGFQALKKALAMKPAEVVEVVKQSGLRGRGGAGFPTGLKWEAAMRADGAEKFVVCNCDEGDPGAFMDRSILEGDPFCIVEAMAIAGHAIGARKGYVHVRAEYPLAFARLAKAVENARSAGYLGERFDIELRAGAGAFVCGEETALLRSLEGHRPHPRPRPPYPAHEGLWGKPTLVNNVETLASIPPILRHGTDWFRSFGTPSSPGTKVFALAGDVLHTGLVEVPMGTRLRTVVHDIGGGVRDGKALKAVQIGGPSGGCIPASLLDTPLDYESLAKLDTIMGSGGLIVLSESACMVNLAKFFMEFVQAESCGRCVPCRLGTKRMLDLVTGICEGRGEPGDLAELEDLGRKIKLTALCGLGRTAPTPVLSTLRHFRDEYDFHIKEKRCPAKVCRPAFRYRIDPARCNGCGNCLPACEDKAILPQPASPYVLGPYVIRQERCDACGDCVEKCPFDAIVRE